MSLFVFILYYQFCRSGRIYDTAIYCLSGRYYSLALLLCLGVLINAEGPLGITGTGNKDKIHMTTSGCQSCGIISIAGHIISHYYNLMTNYLYLLLPSQPVSNIFQGVIPLRKSPKLILGGGVNPFQKSPKFKKVPTPLGGGSCPLWTNSQVWLLFRLESFPQSHFIQYKFQYVTEGS